MTTIHRAARGVPLTHGTQSGIGSMRELATRQVVPWEPRAFRALLDAPGSGTPDVPAAPAAPAVRGGVVSRGALFGRLAEAERVVQISAPAGSGKTVLMPADPPHGAGDRR